MREVVLLELAEEWLETRQCGRGQPCVAVQIYIECVPRNEEKAAVIQNFDPALLPFVVVSQCATTTTLRGRLVDLSLKVPTAMATISKDFDKVPGEICPQDGTQLLHCK